MTFPIATPIATPNVRLRPARLMLALSALLGLSTMPVTARPALAAPASAPVAASCLALKLDLEQGTLNGVSLKASRAEFEKALPCKYEEGSSMNGVNLFYADQGLNLYLSRKTNVVTIYPAGKPPFKGLLSQALLAKPMAEVETLLGPPDHSAREEIDPDLGSYYSYALYTRPWGTLILKYGAGDPAQIEELVMTSQPIDQLKPEY